MYAVVRTGGQQFKVNEGDTIQVAKLETPVGGTVTLDEVLLLGGGDPIIGTPTIVGASVTAEVTDQGRAPKIVVFKIKRRKNYRRKNGHRQPYTELRITGINYDPSAVNAR
jgi:large subunit ribosomal protein L21